MGLAEDMVAAYFDAEPPHLGLARGAAEVEAAGYRRAPGTWRRDEATASGVGRFGPFLDPVAFDTALLIRHGRVVGTVALSGEVRLPPGTEHTQEVVVALAEAG